MCVCVCVRVCVCVGKLSCNGGRISTCSSCVRVCVRVAETELCPHVQYDFTMEDVPERDPRQVDSATEDTSEILTLLKEEMVCC